MNKLCAIAELEILGHIFPPELKESIIRAEENKRIEREKKKAEKDNNSIESDDTFAFIAEYTSGSFPYGTTWEEMENDK